PPPAPLPPPPVIRPPAPSPGPADSPAAPPASPAFPPELGPALAQRLPPPTAAPPAGFFKAIQLYNAYLVLETPEGMLVIDQHALHERILFEQFKARLREGPLEMQRLLMPEPVELSADQASRLLDQRGALAELGLEVDDFGGG